MRYSQGDGLNTSLYRLMYCTHVLLSSVLYIVYGNLPRHGRVLPGTIIKIICVHELYLQG